LNRDPKNRIGVNSKDEIKNHDFFSDINWKLLYQRKLEPPINLVDIKQEFNKENPVGIKEIAFKDRDYQEKNADYNRVKNFTFVRPQSPKESNLKNS
jgi:serum/glucocorticoid-regulated kinase 2